MYTLIGVIICRPRFSPGVLLQLSDKITDSERKSYCAGLRVKMESLSSNPEAGCRESANQKMSISRSRCEKKDSPSKTVMGMGHDEDTSSVSCVPHVTTAFGYT